MARKEQKLVIGYWVDGVREDGAKTGLREFHPGPTQPDDPITDVNKFVAWAKANITDPGEYDLVRVVPGKLTIGIQQTMSAVLQ